MIITIDGAIATGKSTIAKKLAHSIGFIYFDTGAMYRCLTYGILKNNINVDNPQELTDYLDHFHFEIKIKHGDRHYFVEGEDVTDAIRGHAVTANVSRLSAMKPMRDKLVVSQREFAKGVNAVFEGRDMGTIVFPDAEVKVYLTGRPEIRAKRRYEEFKTKYPEEYKDLTFEQTLEDINKRDLVDSTRDLSPLRQAEGAIVIDTSDLTLDEIITRIQEYKDTRKTRLPPK